MDKGHSPAEASKESTNSDSLRFDDNESAEKTRSQGTRKVLVNEESRH